VIRKFGSRKVWKRTSKSDHVSAFDIENAGQPVCGLSAGWRSRGKWDIKNKQISDRAAALYNV